MLQSLLVWAIVAASAAYASWVLMPQDWRRTIARRLGRPPPASSCGGCDGCAPPPAEERPVHMFRRPR